MINYQHINFIIYFNNYINLLDAFGEYLGNFVFIFEQISFIPGFWTPNVMDIIFFTNKFN
jgi:hypothetical protein